MTKNVGTSEAHARTIAAAVLVLVALFLVENPYLRIVLALMSGILAATAFLNTCPINHLMGRNTCDVPADANAAEEVEDEESATSSAEEEVEEDTSDNETAESEESTEDTSK